MQFYLRAELIENLILKEAIKTWKPQNENT